MNLNQDPVGIILPKWFLQLAGASISIFMMTFLPWCTWMTYTTIVLNVKMDGVGDVSESLDAVLAEQIKRSGNVAIVEQLQQIANRNQQELLKLIERVRAIEASK